MNHEASIKLNPWLIAATVILPTFMEVLDTTVVSVSLPHIAGNLSAPTSEATWVQTSYLISNAVVLPASAWFSSFFGRKRFLLLCISLFTLASLVCGLAPTLGLLIVARIVQGAGGGALQPISQAILLESFPADKRGRGMAAYVLGVVIAPVVGPVIGGWVTDNYSWRWLFYMNIPVGLLALWMVGRFIFDPDYVRASKPGRIDAVGFGLLIVWLGTMQTVLDKGQDADWFGAVWIRWFSLVSALAFIAFVIWELRALHPIADLRVFKDRNFLVGTVLISVASVLLYAPMTLLPLFLQGLMGYTAYASGVAQMSRGLAALIAMPVIGILVGKIDDRKLIGAGFLLLGISSMRFGNLNLQFSSGYIFVPNFLQGLGITLCMVPLMTVAMGRLRNDQMGNATGLFALARNLAGSIGISLVTAMVARAAQVHQTILVARATPYDPAYQNTLQLTRDALEQQMGMVQANSGALALIYQGISQQSNMLAYVDDFRLLAFICFAAIPIVLMLKHVVAKGPITAH